MKHLPLMINFLVDIAPLVGGTSTLILAILYYFQFRTGRRQAEQQKSLVELQRNQVESQYKPHIVILKKEIMPDSKIYDSLHLTMSNEGNGIAHNLRIETKLFINESEDHYANYTQIENEEDLGRYSSLDSLLIEPGKVTKIVDPFQVRSSQSLLSAGSKYEDGESVSKLSPDDGELYFHGAIQFSRRTKQDGQNFHPDEVNENMSKILTYLREAGFRRVYILINFEYQDLLENTRKENIYRQYVELFIQDPNDLEEWSDRWHYWDVDLEKLGE